MKFALQRCCTTPIFLKQYETSTNAILGKLDVGLVDIETFNCCGYPLRNKEPLAYILASARNLSLAERENLNVMTFCNCCYGSLRHVNHLMKENSAVRQETNLKLEKEGLEYDGGVDIRHLLGLLYKDIGIKEIEKHVARKFHGLRIATHYGCHLLRPTPIIQFDNPTAPTIFDQLVEMTGAESIPWPKKLECCGSPLWGVNEELSLDLLEQKIVNALDAGADYLCVACSYCQLQFDRVQKILIQRRKMERHLSSILYTQLLGLSLGIDEKQLGLSDNVLDVTGVKDFLSAEPEQLVDKRQRS